MPGTPSAPPDAPTPFRPGRPVVIGLLGGVAAGKSAVAAAFAAHGLRHVDADAIARAVTREPGVVRAVATAFGSDVVAADGQLDRPRLAQKVFADESARSRLETIVHPPVHAAIEGELAAARREGVSVLLDVPLLLERGWAPSCDLLVFVHASDAVRRARAATRGWADGELARREAAQTPLDEKRRRAHRVLDNDGSLDAVRAQVAALLADLAGSRA